MEQREKEAKALKSFLGFSLIGSLALHIGVLTFGIGISLNRVPKVEAEPVEVVVVDPPIPEVEQSPEKTRKANSSGGSAALGSKSKAKSQSGSAGIEVTRNSNRQSSPRFTPSSRPKASSGTLPKSAPIASPPRAAVEKQPQPNANTSQQELIDDLKTAPAQKQKPSSIETVRKPEPVATMRPEVAASPKPVSPSPQLGATPKPIPTSQPPQISSVAPAQTPPGFAKLKDQLARERIAANTTSASETPSGAGPSPRIAAGSRDRTTNSTNASSGSTSGQGSGRGSIDGSTAGQGSGRGSINGSTAGQGSPVATGTGTARQGTPRGQGSGEGDLEGSGSGRVACRSNCKPDYPGRARRQGQEGKVAIRVVADANGKVTSAKIARSSGNSELDAAALKQARRAKIEAPPGKPVTMNFSFSLKN